MRSAFTRPQVGQRNSWTENFDDDLPTSRRPGSISPVRAVFGPATQRQEREKSSSRHYQSRAYQILRGRLFWNKRSADTLHKAIEHFQRASALDPNFAQAHAALAETYVIYNFYAVEYDREAFPKGRVAATRALAIDGELAEAHAAPGLVKSQYDFDWNGAEKSYLRAIELNPNYPTARQWYGEFLAFRSRTDESLTQMYKAIELDPTSLSTNSAPALPLLLSQQYVKALEVATRSWRWTRISPSRSITKHELCSDWKQDEAFETSGRLSRHPTAACF